MKKEMVAGVTVLTLESGILLLVRQFLDFNAGLLSIMATLRFFVNGMLAAYRMYKNVRNFNIQGTT